MVTVKILRYYKSTVGEVRTAEPFLRICKSARMAKNFLALIDPKIQWYNHNMSLYHTMSYLSHMAVPFGFSDSNLLL